MIPDDDETDTVLASADDISPGRMANIGTAAEEPGADYDVPVEIKTVRDTAMMPIRRIPRLGRGAVVELDRVVGQ